MKLFYMPGACSIGIHVVLEEIGTPFEAVRVTPATRAELDAVNPKGKVPTIQRDDGSIVTEYPVIAHYLAETNPGAGLWPTDKEAALRAAEAMDYCVATIHMQGFSRVFRPGNFTPNEADHEAVKARGRELMEKGFAVMAKQLGDKHWVAGEYSVADSALFYVEYWAGKRLKMALPPPLAGHLDRMMARPAVQRMMATEGLDAG